MKHQIGLVFLSLAALSLTGCTSGGTYPDADKYLVGNQTYSENISELDIDWISGSLTLIEDATIEGVKVEEVTTYTNEKELVHSYLNDGVLKIHYFASGHYSMKMVGDKKDLTVTYKPGLVKLNVDLTSGELKASSLTAKEFSFDMTSGKAEVDNIITEKMEIDLTSGSTNFKKVITKDFDLDATSGTCEVNFDSVEKGKFSLTSGNIHLGMPLLGGTVKVSKTSGSVKTERDCTISDDVYKFGDGTADISVSMTSGHLLIK